MNHRSLAPILALTLVGFGLDSVPAHAQGLYISQAEEGQVRRITIYPAHEPEPPLKYQLLPGFLERTSGNAAVYYGKVTAEQLRFFSDQELWDAIREWAGAPLEKLRSDEVRKSKYYRSIRSPGSIFDFLERAACCDHCDWQLPIREGDFFSILLPEVQQAREFARLLAAKARLEIAEGQFDQALRTLRTGYALGRHVAEGESLVHALVAVAISHMMSDQVLEMIQQPDAPNLYWALTMLPRPLIDMRKPVEVEMNGPYLAFPELREVDASEHSPEYWRGLLDSFVTKLAALQADSLPASEVRPWALVMWGIEGYPRAKRALLQQGRSPEEIEAMPVAQVVLLYTRQKYDELRDQTFKWCFVPYWQATAGMDQAESLLAKARAERQEIIPLASLLLPAVRAARAACVRADQQIAALRTIEALRLYAAEHNGQLPEKFADLTVPAPIDPVTGRPVEHQLREGAAVIQGSPLPGVVLHLEVRVGKP